jgi:hypothetical protein
VPSKHVWNVIRQSREDKSSHESRRKEEGILVSVKLS